MVTRSTRSRLAALLVLLASNAAPTPASDIATGTLLGSVSDSEGGRLPGVVVTASNTATGFSRSWRTDGMGRFQIRLLPPGIYTLHAELEGFAPFEQREIQLRVGDALTLRLTLELATVTDELVVTEGTPLIETARSSITSTVDARAIGQLPMNGRDFSDLVLLAPQVTFRIGRPVVAGNEGLMNSFNVDGADSNSTFFGEQLGGAAPPFTYSQTAIQEFQVLRSSYNVRFGGASGGIINAVTKTGTNELKGGAVFFLQDNRMVATDAFGLEQPDFERLQVGFNLGGPIQRDELHFFVAYDGQRSDRNTGNRPVGLPRELEPAFTAKLASLGIDADSEYDFIHTNDADVLLLRLDWTVSPGHRFWMRSNWLDQGGENSTFAFRSSGRSNLGRAESRFHSTVLSLDSILGTRAFNEAIVQHLPARRPNRPNATDTPQISIGGFAFDALIGQSWILPNSLDEDRLQLQDNITLQLRDHTLRFGLDYSFLDLDNFFLFQGGGFFLVPTYEEFVKDQPCREVFSCFYIQAFSPTDGRLDYESHLLSLYAGDEWRLSPRWTLEYGVRLEHQDHPSAQNPNPLEPRTANIPDDTNLGPRIGFAWDIRGDGRSVLRGGGGIFYSWTPTLVATQSILQNGVNASSLFLVAGLPLFPEFPGRLPAEIGALGRQPPDIFLMDSDFENPETRRFSLAYEQAVGANWRLGAEMVYSESRHRVRQWDVNLDPTPVDFAPDGRPIYGVNNPFPERARLDPDFNQKNQFTSDAEAQYLALVLTAKKRFSDNWDLRAHYTYAEWKDHDTAETDLFLFVPEDHYSLDQDWSWASYDVRHRILLSGSYSAPFGFTISLIGDYESASPLNPFSNDDLNRDGFFWDRPGPDPALGLDTHLGRNSFRTSSFKRFDLRLAKVFRLSSQHEIELVADVFNVTNEFNAASWDENFTRGGELNPDFGRPLAADLPRAWQVGLRYRFE